jgi:excisionase family DNA binding protein
MQKLSDYVMTAEAAEILGVSQNTLRACATDGKIPLHREATQRHTKRTVTRNSARIEED